MGAASRIFESASATRNFEHFFIKFRYIQTYYNGQK